MSDPHSYFQPEELQEWQFGLKQADHNNVLCHCRQCDREWIDSAHEIRCTCGSTDVESISCWQFPDG